MSLEVWDGIRNSITRDLIIRHDMGTRHGPVSRSSGDPSIHASPIGQDHPQRDADRPRIPPFPPPPLCQAEASPEEEEERDGVLLPVGVHVVSDCLVAVLSCPNDQPATNMIL